MRRLRGPLAAAFILCGTSCVGDGTGSFDGTLYLRGCTLAADYGTLAAPRGYDMSPGFFVAYPLNVPVGEQAGSNQGANPPLHPVNKLTIRVEPGTGKTVEQADLLFVSIADDAQVAAALGQPMTVGPTTVVRASLTLSETCPNAEVEPELDGTITFTAFGDGKVKDGIQFGDRVAAHFSFDVVDRRQVSIGGLGSVPVDPATAGHLEGSFDFVVRQGKAAQPF